MLNKWVSFQARRREARRWIRANGVGVVAEAMFRLNREARRGSGDTGLIYSLKNLLVKYLYERGYCVATAEQRQDMVCWSCNGTGERWRGDEACYKCWGSGVYRSHRLYRFEFEVGGRRYVWHQPASLVNWEVRLTEPAGVYEAGGVTVGGLSLELKLLYVATVYEFLRMAGVTPPEVPTLRECLRRDWRASRWRRRWWRLRRWRQRAREWVDRVSRLAPGQLALTPVERRAVRLLEYRYSPTLDSYRARVRFVDDGRVVTCGWAELIPFHPLRRLVWSWREWLLIALGPEDEIPF